MTSPAPSTTSDVRCAFLEVVRVSGLLTPAQFARAEAAIPLEIATKLEAARMLVAAGLLTKFQIERLIAGRTDGFHLGPYIIQDQIGRGSLGRVYRARHRTMNRSVAIKVLSSDVTRSEDDRQALQREVRASAQLNHHNIVTAYDANELADRHYLVLEYVDGPNLETLVRERGPMPIFEACELARQMALGLAHAHANGMVHWNFKPSNLLVTRSATHPGFVLKIADFGVAKLATSQTPTPVEKHRNPDYVAPELARNLITADHRVDLYSLGAVFYFLLAGRPLFSEGTAEEKICRHLLDEPVRIDQFRHDVPPHVVALIHQLLAKHPRCRPISAVEVAERLDGPCGTGGNSVNFELFTPNVKPYPYGASQSSGGYPASGMDSSAANSGRYSLPESAAYPALNPSDACSSWEQITGAHRAVDEDTLVFLPRQKRRRNSSSWGVYGVIAGILLTSLAAICVLVKMMTK